MLYIMVFSFLWEVIKRRENAGRGAFSTSDIVKSRSDSTRGKSLTENVDYTNKGNERVGALRA